MMKKLLGVFVVMTLLLATTNFTSAGDNHIRASLQPVDDSGVTGTVNLVALPQDRGTFISVVAFGLEDGEEYVSLYYENHTCELEPYSEEDEIGTYTGNGGGVGIAIGEADDPLDDVNSVSVRRASDFALLACADIHPDIGLGDLCSIPVMSKNQSTQEICLLKREIERLEKPCKLIPLAGFGLM